ncbi:MAG: phosphatidate cytidylyltransferase [Lachnospiraceae bacterium]
MLIRIVSGAVLTAIAFGTIFVGDWVLALTVCLVGLTGFYELSKATGVHEKGKKINLLELAGYAGIIGYYCAMYFTGETSMMMMSVIVTLTLIMMMYVFTFPKYSAGQMMSLGFSILYCPIMLSYMFLIRELPHGIYLIWLVFVCSWISDTFAYLVGVSIGKHKYLPKLSPKKSIEGSLGGIAGSALVAAGYGYFCLQKIIDTPNLIWILVIMGVVGSVISQIGDLAASAIKRNHEIKDYGRIIPGHGGVMDRFDSVIFTAPIIYYLCYYLL